MNTATEQAKIIYLKDYRKPAYVITDTELYFDLHEDYTRVRARLQVRRNGEAGAAAPLQLNGENLKLLEVKLDGRALLPSEYTVSDTYLTLPSVPAAFVLEIEVEIEPQNNKALEGLYKSGDIFCTQNEPDGFRRISYFIDRPDMMSRYTTTIAAERKKYPVLLSNGNPIEQGELPGGRHFVKWQDPFPKPSYLFAVVAGDLGMLEDFFVTRSGRRIVLRIFVDRGNEPRARHAMDSLKKAMKWDEEVFGLEYDLDIYMIVAVNAFNSGAMENKGLNIFNSQNVLANPQTATDNDYEAILGVIGHEYFHNWTGNRVTCRDWFQLTLKEGFTVFRDCKFSADMTSRAVKRINWVRGLRDFQFVEDAGPNAHPIRPDSYMEIRNFYTSTVYVKGAEVIRMVETLLGEPVFKKGVAKYFELYDGQAVTTEDFLHAMQLASGLDLTQFRRWYDQAGTPVCRVSGRYLPGRKAYELEVEQVLPQTPDGREKRAYYFPLKVGLIGPDGKDFALEKDVLHVSKMKETFVFPDIAAPPVPSLLRDFSAPVKLEFPYTVDELIFLLAHDSDPVNRYEAGQRLAAMAMKEMIAARGKGEPMRLDARLNEAFGRVLGDESLDPAFMAEAWVLPSVTALTEAMEVCDFEGAFLAREVFIKALAASHEKRLTGIYEKYHGRPYAIDPLSIGRRTLKNRALSYLVNLEKPEYFALAYEQFRKADNMTDSILSLAILAHTGSPEREKALHEFYAKWKQEFLVINKWLAVQAESKRPDTLDCVKRLEKDAVFDRQNPNKIRALYGVFAGNLLRFHDAAGAGYSFVADKILEIDAFNPQVAARLSTCFKKFAKLDAGRKEKMGRELDRILAAKSLSRDVYEIVSNTRRQA